MLCPRLSVSRLRHPVKLKGKWKFEGRLKGGGRVGGGTTREISSKFQLERWEILKIYTSIAVFVLFCCLLIYVCLKR